MELSQIYIDSEVIKVINVKRNSNISIKDILVDKIIYIVLIALLIAIVIIEPKFLSLVNFKNIFAQSATKLS